MGIGAPKDITKCRRFFAAPSHPRQRRYEALRAFFLEGRASHEVARAFGYSPGSFRVLCHEFRRDRDPAFFASPAPGPRAQPKKAKAHDLAVALRKQNHSVYEIAAALKERGMPLSPTAVRELLRAEGFAPLPRRLDEERPARTGPTVEPVADVRRFALSAGTAFTTRLGGLFLFLPELVRLHSETLASAARLPGSRMIPAPHALRAALALKLWSIERKSHVMALVADPGLALFCGLNAIPKKSYLAEYSSRLDHAKTTSLLAAWHRALAQDQLFPGASFNLDFHSVPYYGEDPQLERHYVAMRSRAQPSVLAFLAQDAEGHAFCYSNADLRKGEEAEEIFRFIAFWKQHHGELPRHLVFDSRLTTYAHLARLDALGITFITLRRRSPSLLAEIEDLAPSAWRRVSLDVPARKYKTPRVFEQPVALAGATRGTHHPAHQRPAHDPGQADHPLRAAHAHRERALRRGTLLPHGCAVLGGRPQGGFRYGAAGDRERPLSSARPTHARLCRCAGAPHLSRPHRYPSRCDHLRARSPRALPPPRALTDHHRFGHPGLASQGALVGQLHPTPERVGPADN